MSASIQEKRSILTDFLLWLNWLDDDPFGIPSILADYEAERLYPCDTAIASGPGHQSIHPCIRTGPHVGHTDNRYEWIEADLTEQTALHPHHKQREEGVRLRLAFSRD